MNDRRFDTVLFDLGDTLIYFDDDWSKIFLLAKEKLLDSLQSRGLPLDKSFLDEFSSRMDEYYRERDTEFLEHTTRYVLSTTLNDWGYPNLPDSLISASLTDMYVVTQANWIPEEDALDTLEQLRQQGYRMALISNAADDSNTQVLVDKLGGRHYFDVVMSSAFAGIRKPNPKIFHSVLRQMNVSPGRAVMVGDTLGADILGAQNAGIFSVWITRRANNPSNQAHMDTIIPDARISTLAELPALLYSLDITY